ncbi:MAG: hypothetical protein ACREPA_05280 [Candidatus Dormibacteraceae bacterium]
MTRYIDEHKREFGVEPICRVLQFAPATYYAAACRPPSARRLRDEGLKPQALQVWQENRRVYVQTGSGPSSGGRASRLSVARSSG